MLSLEKLKVHCQAEIVANLAKAAEEFGVPLLASGNADDDNVDRAQIDFLTKLAGTSGMPLPDFVRLVRGQTSDDPRPNKDLFELPPPPTAELLEPWRRWNAVVRDGVVPEWQPHRPAAQRDRPKNHGSIATNLPNVWRHIRKGQKDSRYLVVDASLADEWPEIFISPIGVVEKAGSPADVRIINDYSYPEGASVNDYSDRSHLPDISYNPPSDIAKRIHGLRQDHPYARILLMLGDVAGAFRHVSVHADHAHMFAFIIDGLLVIDLACGFGWCGSPAWYYLPGVLINGLYEYHTYSIPAPVSLPRHGSFWCDDHTCVELDHGLQCFAANLALRRAMATVLGPAAINEKKFTVWSERGRALGLDWDTQNGTVTIPSVKIEKAQRRILGILSAGTISKTDALSLVGSLRHIATCCPPAKAFFQRLQDMATQLGRYGRRVLATPAREDLLWFLVILRSDHRFTGIPVEHFAGMALPSVDVYMDASNVGLCALVPALKQYIRVRFTAAKQASFTADTSVNSINVRELQSAVLAALIWGPVWEASNSTGLVRVRFWIDNASAVSWAKRRASRHPTAQLYNRLLSLAEFNYSLACTAEHIPGIENTMADAGSRAWSPTDPLFATWTNLSRAWTQVPITAPYDNLSRLWEGCCAGVPSLTLPPPSTARIGISGASSAV